MNDVKSWAGIVADGEELKLLDVDNKFRRPGGEPERKLLGVE